MTDNLDRDVWVLIKDFNRDREPKIVARKYEKMRANPFSFFRGSCHLFYRDLPSTSALNLAPLVWICGDLHIENFGTYKGDDSPKEKERQIYFGINDFDEGELAPCTWDLTRLITSILLAVESLNFASTDGERLAQLCIDRYTTTLQAGKIQAIVEDNATGIIGELLVDLRDRNRRDLLNERTELINNRRHLKFDDEKVLKASQQQRDVVSSSIEIWAQSQANPEFYEVLDIGFRLAGTGSLGLERYLILVSGKGSPVGKASPLENRNYLLDLKQQPASALEPYLTTTQPQWPNQATRILTIQHLVQSAPPALLSALDFNKRSYLLRELQPTQDKLNLKVGKVSLLELERVVATIAEITAFAHLHGSGKLGAVSDRELIDFGHRLDWQQEVLLYANNYARQVRIDYEYFDRASRNL